MIPKTLNLGSGKDWKDSYFNADILLRVNPDWWCDISKVEFGQVIDSHRFGKVEIKKGMFERVVANDVLEHIPDLVAAMTNCKDLLADGGEFHINVPYELSLGAWQDPTHVRAFNENSWLYYTDWHWYLGWQDRFNLSSMEFKLSEFGQEMMDKGIPDQEILRTPRAVDSMKVVLTKISLQSV
jgi:SAM-dependent methyltransferase